jgi:chemotaxis signal transduction protein
VIDLGLLLGSSACTDRLSTRIILVNSAPGGHNQGKATRDTGPGRGDARLIGLIAEQVSDLIEVAAEQVTLAPVHLARAPYLDAIARTDRGFVPLIAAAKLALVLGGPAGSSSEDEETPTPVRYEAEDEQARPGTPVND